MTEAREKRKSKGKDEKQRDIDHFARNQEKLRISKVNYTKNLARVKAISRAMLASKHPRLNNAMVNMMKFQMRYFETLHLKAQEIGQCVKMIE